MTDNSYQDKDPQISGKNVVWKGFDGSDYEIFMAVYPCPYILAGDLNDDCKVNFVDITSIASNWLIDCFADPCNPACVPK